MTECRPSAPTTRSARISRGPDGASASTPTTRSVSRISWVASVFIINRKPGCSLAFRLTKSRKSRDPLAEQVEIEMIHARVRHAQELVEHTELVHQLERRRVDGVAAEIAEE